MKSLRSYQNLTLKDYQVIAKEVIELAKDNNTLCFKGDLGAGKTTLIKIICNFLNVIDEVNSPTYALVNEYRTKQDSVIYHFDFYRINDIEEAYDIGFEDYLYSGNLCLIEWPEKVEPLISESYIEIVFKINKDSRDISINLINNV